MVVAAGSGKTKSVSCSWIFTGLKSEELYKKWMFCLLNMTNKEARCEPKHKHFFGDRGHTPLIPLSLFNSARPLEPIPHPRFSSHCYLRISSKIAPGFLAMKISHDQQDQGSCRDIRSWRWCNSRQRTNNQYDPLSLSHSVQLPYFSCALLSVSVFLQIIMADRRARKRLANNRDLAVSTPGTNTPVPGHDSGLPN
jgi:hypothetical protein